MNEEKNLHDEAMDEATTVDGMREQNIDIYYRLIGKIV